MFNYSEVTQFESLMTWTGVITSIIFALSTLLKATQSLKNNGQKAGIRGKTVLVSRKQN